MLLTRGLLLAACHSLLATRYPLPTTYYRLPTTHYLLPTTDYPLPTTCDLLLATRRARSALPPGRALVRVVHVGDAPADVLAARACAERGLLGAGVCVGMVGCATGSYTVAQLRELAGAAVPGSWEPVVLEKGMGDAGFLAACGIAE